MQARISKETAINYYPHHIGDFDKATRHLTRTERSIYRDLLDVYYHTELPLTLDLAALCRKVLARTDEERTAVEQTLNEFFTKTDIGWSNSRCEAEICAYHKKLASASGAGKASAEKRAAERASALKAASENASPDKTASESGTNGNPTSVEQTFNAEATNQNQNQNQEPEEEQKHAPAAQPLSLVPTEPVAPKRPKRPPSEKSNPQQVADAALAMPLPAGLDRDDWSRWIAYRLNRKKADVTMDAVGVWLRELGKIAAAGQDVAETIDRSIGGGWSGLFPRDSPQRGAVAMTDTGRPMNRQEALEESNRQIAEAWARGG